MGQVDSSDMPFRTFRPRPTSTPSPGHQRSQATTGSRHLPSPPPGFLWWFIACWFWGLGGEVQAAILPEGFPEDEVPVLDGEILMGTASEGEGYMVVVTVEDEPGAALDEAVSLLEGAGFESDPEMGDMMGETAALLTSAKYSVMVTAAADTGQTGVTYIVTVE